MTNKREIEDQAYEFNEEFFEGRIPPFCLNVKISDRMTRVRGTFNPSKGIKLSSLLLVDEHEWKSTLLHEMIHAWEYFVLHAKPGHRLNFKRKAREIAQRTNGQYNITRCTAGGEAFQQEVANRMEQKARQSRSIQYMVQNHREQINFIKNLQSYEIHQLRNRGYIVHRMKKEIPNVRNKKNFSYLLRWGSYYEQRRLERLLGYSIECTEVVR